MGQRHFRGKAHLCLDMNAESSFCTSCSLCPHFCTSCEISQNVAVPLEFMGGSVEPCNKHFRQDVLRELVQNYKNLGEKNSQSTSQGVYYGHIDPHQPQLCLQFCLPFFSFGVTFDSEMKDGQTQESLSIFSVLRSDNLNLSCLLLSCFCRLNC